MKTCILWFRNNLRIGDNWPVVEAYTQYDLVIPVYIDEGSQHNQKWAQGPRGEYREAFLIDSLIDLNAGLMAYDSELVVIREKDAVKTLQSLAIEVGAMAIIGPKEFAFNEVTQETALQQWGKQKGLKITFYNERTLFLQSDLPFALEALPDVFSRFRGKVEKYSNVRAPIEEADISPFDPDEFNIKGVSLTKSEIDQDDRSAVPFSKEGILVLGKN
jgi:deoxyribodipyrimidine photo-lyase